MATLIAPEKPACETEADYFTQAMRHRLNYLFENFGAVGNLENKAPEALPGISSHAANNKIDPYICDVEFKIPTSTFPLREGKSLYDLEETTARLNLFFIHYLILGYNIFF